MKKTILLLSTILIGFVVLAQRIEEVKKAEPVVGIEEAKQEQTEESSSNATIDFESKVYDYGVLEHNGNGDGEFIFTNNSLGAS
mgnify:CR=1 FL=1